MNIESRYVTVFSKTAPPQIKGCIDHFKKNIFNKYSRDKRDVVTGEYTTDVVECFVAGGAVRDYFLGKTPNDIDIFFPSKLEMHEFSERISEKHGLDSKKLLVAENANVIKVKLKKEEKKIDLVKLYHPSAQHAIKSFDFTVCAVAVTPNYITYHENFFLDLATKRLSLNTTPTALNILYRLQKYIKKGYEMSPTELLKIITTFKNLDISQEEIDKCLKSNEWEYKLPSSLGVPF